MNAIVIYGSRYGTTKQYASWIAEELGCKAVDYKSVKLGDLDKYDTIIAGGGVYVAKFRGYDFFVRLVKEYPDKNYIYFGCCFANPKSEKIIKELGEVFYSDIPDTNKDKIKFFLVRGKLDYSTMGPIHKFMMWGLKKMIEDKSELTEDEQGILDTYGKTTDAVDRTYIEPLIEYAKGL